AGKCRSTGRSCRPSGAVVARAGVASIRCRASRNGAIGVFSAAGSRPRHHPSLWPSRPGFVHDLNIFPPILPANAAGVSAKASNMTVTVARIPLISPAPGTERHVVVRRYGEPGARPKAYIQASTHADELPAMLTAHHLARLLDEAADEGRIRGEIMLVPV